MEQNLTQKVQNLRCLIRLGGGGLDPNETLSHSNGKFVFDHGPYFVSQKGKKSQNYFYLIFSIHEVFYVLMNFLPACH